MEDNQLLADDYFSKAHKFCLLSEIELLQNYPKNKKPWKHISIFIIKLLTVKLSKLELCKKITKSSQNIQQKIENLLTEMEKTLNLSIHYTFLYCSPVA